MWTQVMQRVAGRSRVAAPRRGKWRMTPTVDRLEAREVLSLTLVSATAGYPYTTMVKLDITYPDGKKFVGSGVMVDSFHAMTAGHNLYNYADGGWASKIVVTPKLNGSTAPYGTALMTYERSYTSFTTYNKTHPDSTSTGINDIGLITLNRKIGTSSGTMSYGYDNNDASFSKGTTMNTAGYPATHGYNSLYMYSSTGTLNGLSSDKKALTYYQSQITGYKGQSGSPVWRYTASTNSRVVQGIHVGGDESSTSLNFATRITQAIFNDMESWRKSDKPPATFGTFTASTRNPIPVPLHESFGPATVSDPGLQFVAAMTPLTTRHHPRG